MLDYLSDQDKFVLSVIFGTALLVGIDLLFSQDAWYFAILVVFAWPLEEKFFKWICEQTKSEESTHPIGFLLYVIAILVAASLAVYIGQQFLSPFHLSTSENTTSTFAVSTFLNETITQPLTAQNSSPFNSLNFLFVLGVSAIVSGVCYVVSNWTELNDKYQWVRT